MDTPESHDIVVALRSRSKNSEAAPELQPVTSLALTNSVERTLFQRGGIGPVDAMLQRASMVLDATEDWSSMTDDQLFGLWNDTIEKFALNFSQSPESWNDSASEEFLRRSAVVFGVEDKDIHRLMREFHKSPRESRMAVFLPIRRSTLFSYIDREINEMVDDVEIADPDESFRSLIRAVASTA